MIQVPGSRFCGPPRPSSAWPPLQVSRFGAHSSLALGLFWVVPSDSVYFASGNRPSSPSPSAGLQVSSSQPSGHVAELGGIE